jgi:pyruvate dehydrogenase E2 component (dihydrolipoyllysine-residue acetyltransferase)
MNGNRGETRIEEPSRAQRAIARRAAESRATIPHLEVSRAVLAPADPVLPALVRACALALRAVPRLNGSYRDGRFELYSRVNVGVVLPSADAFAIPTLFDADQKPVGELAGELEDLAARALRGELLPPELAGGTFTFSQVEADRAPPLIVPGQAGALCAGSVCETAMTRDGEVAIKRTVVLTVACDHRIVYGPDGARFLAEVAAQV